MVNKKTSREVQLKKLKNAYEKAVAKIEADHKSMVSKYDTLAESKTDKPKEQTKAEYMTMALLEAERIWYGLNVVSLNPEFMKLNDEEKLMSIRKEFMEFSDNFPIVIKFMVCMGQYSRNAFRKFLKICEERLNGAIAMEAAKKEKGYMERQWIECQAFYVRFLWEHYNTKHINLKESEAVWKHAVEELTAEFQQFRELHANTEDKVKHDTNRRKTLLLNEMVERIATGEQKLDEQDMQTLVNKLKNTLFKQRYRKVVDSIKSDVSFRMASVVSKGTNEEAMYEHESELKQHELKKKYKKLDLNPTVTDSST